LVRADVVLTARHCRAASYVVFGADIREPFLMRSILGWQVPPT